MENTEGVNSKKIRYPHRETNFYFLKPFLSHQHNEETANSVYVVPWDNNRIFFTTKRDPLCSGCVGCLIRRLIATTYHKKANIDGIDSVWTKDSFELSEKIREKALEIAFLPMSSTATWVWDIKSEIFEEIHVYPTPACLCKTKSAPIIENDVKDWIVKWPNVILKEIYPQLPYTTYHIRAALLPNTAYLFLQNPTDKIHVSNAPTAAGFCDDASLAKRLEGESIERYALKYLPEEKLFADSECSLPISLQQQLPENIWTKVTDLSEKSVNCKADRVYSILHQLDPKKFLPLSSSGVAAHINETKAREGALLEILERDALLTAWRIAGQGKENLFIELPNNLHIEVKEIERMKQLLKYEKYNLVLMGIDNLYKLPVVLACAFPQEEMLPSIPHFGSGISYDWKRATKKALQELLQGVLSQKEKPIIRKPSTFAERPLYWGTIDRLSLLKKLLNPNSQPGDSSSPRSFQELILKLKEKNDEIYFADLTTPDIKLAGWSVVRAFCLKYEPFVGNFDEELPCLDRVNKFLQDKKLPLIEKLNLDPYPFP